VSASEDRARIVAIASLLRKQEAMVARALLERLLDGQLEYGPLDLAKDKRDWKQEEAMEAVDGTWYRQFRAIAKLLKSARKRDKRPGRKAGNGR
jgi:hypothetical protein